MVIKWVKEKRAHHRQELLLIEEHISLLFSDSLLGYFSNEGKRTLLRLETVKNNIFRIEQESWRLKIRAIWVKQGYCNSKLFQKFASHHRNQNSIWDLKDAYGKSICESQTELKTKSVQHFGHIFNDTSTLEIGEQLEVIIHFLRFFLLKKRGFKWVERLH